MSSQLLGANASLNAPGGVPGAAPTVLQGALVTSGETVNGNSQVNGSLTVTQPIGGGVRTAFFTDGGVGALENSIGIFLDQASTQLVFADSGNGGILSYEGTGQANTGEFTLSKPLRTPIITGTAGTINFATPTDPNTFVFNCPTAGGGTVAMAITDNQAGVNGNFFNFLLNQGNTQMIIADNGTAATISYDGAVERVNYDKPIQHPAGQAGFITGSARNVIIPLPSITANSVVLVTPRGAGLGAAVTSPPYVVLNAGVGFSIQWAGGTDTGEFSWFVAQY